MGIIHRTMNSLNYLRDNRTESRAKFDYQHAMDFELRVMKGLVSEAGQFGIDAWYNKIDELETFADNRLHITPDFYLYADKVYTFEIKGSITGNWKNNTIFVKPYSIKTMLSNRELYPNPYLICASETEYARMPASKVASYGSQPIPNWSTDEKTKYGYIIPVDDFTWRRWKFKI